MSRGPNRGGSGTLKVDAAHAVPPDLKIEVLDRAKDDKTFVVQIQSPWLPELRKPVEDEWTLPSKAEDIVTGYMAEFTAKGKSLADRLLSLKGAGIELWRLAAPKIFKQAYLELVQKHPHETILVVSEERNIPWELMIPTGKGVKDSRPLGVAASVSRWFDSTELRSPGAPLSDARVVAGNHDPSLAKPLKNAVAESSWIRNHIGGSQIAHATPSLIDQEISHWHGTVLHFVCHGKANPQSLLLDGKATLTPTQVTGMTDLPAAWGDSAPVVFLNACEVGRPAPSLAGIGGFAKSWAEAGAGAVIAPLWSVRDSIAHDVAMRFYRAVQAEPKTPYARIVRDIRALAFGKAGGEDTYAAYCYFGSPTAAAQMGLAS